MIIEMVINEGTMSTTERKKSSAKGGRPPKGKESRKAVLQIRTSPEEKREWFATAERMGFNSVAECFRSFMNSASETPRKF
jgi:hypothetical protein